MRSSLPTVLIQLSAIIILTSGCMQFRTSSKKIVKRFEANHLEVNIVNRKIEKRNVRYVTINENDHQKPLLIFIHGAPGSSDNYFQFMEDHELTQRLKMISVDRPGYGYSNFGKSVTSIEQQAEIIRSLVEEHSHGQPVILVGHSFGGPIAAKTAVISSGRVQSVIMLAPAIDPENEKIFKIAYLAYRPPFRWITPKSWKVAADEKLTHVFELKKMLPDWEKLESRVVHIHGDKDRLVPYENLAFSRKMISSSILETVSLEGEDHFLPWTQRQLIKETILNQLARPSSASVNE